MKLLAVNFTHDDERKRLCCNIFRHHGGKFVHSGTFLPTMLRDVEHRVPDERVEACIAAQCRL